MKKFIVLCIFALPIFAQNSRIYLPSLINQQSEYKTITYTNSQIDTVIWIRDANAQSISFAAHFSDSIATAVNSAGIIARMVDNAFVPVINGDTLSISNITSTSDAGYIFVGNVVLTPLTDNIAFIITYKGSGNGVTSNNVRYSVQKQYSK